MTSQDSDQASAMDWSDVEGIISDLKSDGYEVAEFESNTSHPVPSKRFFLKVER